MERKAYPSDVTDDEWAFVAPYLTLMTADAPQRSHSLREVCNGLRWLVRAGAPWRMMPKDLLSWEAVYQQTQRWVQAGVCETMVHDVRMLLQDRAQGAQLATQVHDVTGASVEMAFVDQGYMGAHPAQEAAAHGMQLEVVKLPAAKKGFVLLPRRGVVERRNAWAARFRRLARDDERLPETLASLHFLAFAILLLKRFRELMVQSA